MAVHTYNKFFYCKKTQEGILMYQETERFAREFVNNFVRSVLNSTPDPTMALSIFNSFRTGVINTVRNPLLLTEQQSILREVSLNLINEAIDDLQSDISDSLNDIDANQSDNNNNSDDQSDNNNSPRLTI